ncbi:hypothetical protein DUI87_22687 [Hirundo rustica rustica]|uniref:Uncharacterized protein n=1 Tax=Hirundo rustica rustica TaxID=333673 RepID=A0A3M0JQH7_HIRRU|nr:hypothetical protein DUI87_22687 [Hirundo rustica rustica]
MKTFSYPEGPIFHHLRAASTKNNFPESQQIHALAQGERQPGEICLFAMSRKTSQGQPYPDEYRSHSVEIAAWVAHVVLSANSSEPGSGSKRKLCQNPITSSRKIQPGGIQHAWRIAEGNRNNKPAES